MFLRMPTKYVYGEREKQKGIATLNRNKIRETGTQNHVTENVLENFHYKKQEKSSSFP